MTHFTCDFCCGLLADDDNDYDEISIKMPRRNPVFTVTLFWRERC